MPDAPEDVEDLFGEIRAWIHAPRPGEFEWGHLRALLSRLFSLQEYSGHLTVEQIVDYLTQSIDKSSPWSSIERQSLPHWIHAPPDALEQRALAMCNHLVVPDRHTLPLLLEHAPHVRLGTLTTLECTLDAEQVPLLVEVLARTPRLEHLILHGDGALAIDLEPLTDDATRRVAPLPMLTKLDLRRARLGSYGFEHLANLPWLHQLERLNLDANGLHDEHLIALSRLPLHQLEELILEFNSFEFEGITALCTSSTITRLRHLNLSLCELTAGTLHHLPRATWRHTLEKLDVGFNTLGADGIAQLATCHFPNLHTLFIDNQEQSSGEGMEALARASFLPGLTHLSACFDARVPASVWTHDLLPRLSQNLESIDLSYNELDDCLLEELGRALAGRPVKRLELGHTGVGVSSAALLALLGSIDTSELACLSLSATPLEDGHLLAMALQLDRLEELHVELLDRVGEGLVHLLSCIGARTLSMLSMGRQEIDAASREGLTAALARQRIETLHVSHAKGTQEEVLLAIVRACAPTLQTLEIKDNPQLSMAFIEGLCAQPFPALSLLELDRCALTGEALELLLTHTDRERGALPHLRTLSWHDNEAFAEDLRARVPPTLHLIA